MQYLGLCSYKNIFLFTGIHCYDVVLHALLFLLQDQKLKHMAELQLSVVSEAASKRQMETQIVQWEDNLERLHCEQFRLRCYMASLQNGELPNPKVSRYCTVLWDKTCVVWSLSHYHGLITTNAPFLVASCLQWSLASDQRAIFQYIHVTWLSHMV